MLQMLLYPETGFETMAQVTDTHSVVTRTGSICVRQPASSNALCGQLSQCHMTEATEMKGQGTNLAILPWTLLASVTIQPR